MLATGVRRCCQGHAEDAPASRFTPCRMAFHCKSDSTCNPARETLCQSLISDPHTVVLARLEYCHYPTRAFLTSISRLLAFALSPDSTHYPQYRSIQFGRKDFGGVVQRSLSGALDDCDNRRKCMKAIHAIKLAGTALLICGSIQAYAQASDAAPATPATPASTTAGARQHYKSLKSANRALQRQVRSA